MFHLLETFAENITNLVGLDINSHWGEAFSFFIYDTLKIIIMLSFMIFLISYLRSYIHPNKLKKVISKVSGVSGHFLASIFGIVTPFCSCSSVPMFIAFVEAGIPVGVTLSFLITSPIVNEAAFAILLASFGWKVALIYVLCGVLVGVIGGMIISLFKPERWVEAYVFELKIKSEAEDEKMSQKDRIIWSFAQVKEIVGRVWIFVLVGIGIGGIIHGWVPAGALADYAGKDNPFAVVVAVIFGIPLYSNALGTIPIAEVLIQKGVGLGTALAFMMAVTALSLPECIILKKVIKPKLIGIFITTVGVGIILVGTLFNFIF
jgi:uncharacterized membrane protein YraQ (UPF0718 family)